MAEGCKEMKGMAERDQKETGKSLNSENSEGGKRMSEQNPVRRSAALTAKKQS